jgi:uncharacterized BrkB/YihY/UPF0761 family membrane protein
MRERVADARQTADSLRSDARTRFEQERARRSWLRTGYEAWDLDRRRGGPLLAGGVAYRVFLWLLPAALFVVALFGLTSSLAERSPSELAREVGVGSSVAGVIARAVEDTGAARWWLILLGGVLTVWAGRGGARAVELTSSIAWGLPPSTRARSSVLASLAFSAAVTGGIVITWLGDRLVPSIGLLPAWLLATTAIGAVIVVVFDRLPHRSSSMLGLVPGVVLLTVGIRGLAAATDIYFSGRLDRVDDLYGGLGIAIVILLYLYLAARCFVWGQFLNARIAGVGTGDGTTSDGGPG